MTRRYSERIAMHCPVVFTMGSMVGEGEVVDLTNPGCLIQSTAGLDQRVTVWGGIHQDE